MFQEIIRHANFSWQQELLAVVKMQDKEYAEWLDEDDLGIENMKIFDPVSQNEDLPVITIGDHMDDKWDK